MVYLAKPMVNLAKVNGHGRGCGLSEASRDPQIDSMGQELHSREPSPTTTGRAAPPEIALSAEDREALRQAVLALEGPSYVARLSSLAGRPIELLGHALPQAASDLVSRATQAALTRALRYALRTIPKEGRDPETRVHKALAVLSGAMGGALGLSAVLVELPVSTTIMLRSIARIAQSEGEDLEDPATALACLEVFALGGRTGSGNLLGAIGGAAVNAAFVDHFQTLARGHFTVRRLERIYGMGTVRRAYDQLRESLTG